MKIIIMITLLNIAVTSQNATFANKQLKKIEKLSGNEISLPCKFYHAMYNVDASKCALECLEEIQKYGGNNGTDKN